MTGQIPGGALPSDDDGFEERPYGTRPYGTRPYGTRPYGTRPYGTRPYGTRPYGTRPYGTRPYGTRPYGTRPYGTRTDAPEPDPLDPEVWGQEITELFIRRSSVVRLGASLVSDEAYVSVPAVEETPDTARYLGPDPKSKPTVETGEDKPVARISNRTLRTARFELAWKVVIPDTVFQELAHHPEVAWRIKDDIARGLASRADVEFLAGDGQQRRPLGIARQPGTNPVVRADLRRLLRRMLRTCRDLEQDVYELAGWVIHPSTFNAVTKLRQGNRTWDSTRLIEHDGSGGGLLLGYPFALSSATLSPADAVTRIFFSSDWSEAWIGTCPDVVRIDVSFDARFQSDETVIRAVLRHDFTLRRPAVFVHGELA
jgi:hypothetical protein